MKIVEPNNILNQLPPPVNLAEMEERVLKVRQYHRLSKGQKGMVRPFLGKISGFSRAQLTELIGR